VTTDIDTLAVMRALLGHTSEARWHTHLKHLFRYLPQQSGYDKRLRNAAGLIKNVIRMPATDTALWTDSNGTADAPEPE
jgi:hypothetical protein